MRTSIPTFRFGDFAAEVATKELRRKNGTRIRLPQQSFAVLQALLEKPGELVTRAELQERLWPDNTFVDFDHGLNAAVNRLREALGDSSGVPKFIETLPRQGYRFIAAVQHENPSSSGQQAESPETMLREKPKQEDVVAATPSKDPTHLHLLKRKAASIVITIFLVPLLAFLLGFWPRNIPDIQSRHVSVRPLTSFPGEEVSPAFSPDGSQVVFAWDGGDSERKNRFDLYVRVVGSEGVLRLTNMPAEWLVPAWSPDGSTIAFLRMSETAGGIFSIPAIGGPERKLASASFQYAGVQTLSWAPDGKKLAYPNVNWAGAQSFPPGIRILSVDSGQIEEITNPVGCLYTLAPSFSPDGNWLAFTCDTTAGGTIIYAMPFPGGTPHRVIAVGANTDPMAWSKDSKRLIFQKEDSLWEVAIDGSGEKPLEFARDAAQPAIASKGDRLAYASGYQNANIWGVDLNGNKIVSHQLVTSTRGQALADISPDGKRLLFNSDRTGGFGEIWVSDLNGANPIQLTNMKALTGSGRWSPDGTRIAFDSRQNGVAGLYLVDPQGGQPKKISIEISDASIPTWSRDGNSLYFTSTTPPAKQGLYKVVVTGGTPVAISRSLGYNAQEGANGSLYFAVGVTDCEIHLIANGGSETVLRKMPSVLYANDWTLAKDGIYFIDRKNSPASIKFYDFATTKIHLVIELKKEPTVWGGITISQDNRLLVYSQIDERKSDIMLAENYR
jgi:Tol biopolymer transport system component/DNA-binding winged helix-turn-helix (wHTH) protein